MFKLVSYYILLRFELRIRKPYELWFLYHEQLLIFNYRTFPFVPSRYIFYIRFYSKVQNVFLRTSYKF